MEPLDACVDEHHLHHVVQVWPRVVLEEVGIGLPHQFFPLDRVQFPRDRVPQKLSLGVVVSRSRGIGRAALAIGISRGIRVGEKAVTSEVPKFSSMRSDVVGVIRL